ncbi:15744_t:CDS:2 [Funneliformis geosporum]|nr:15744_t:CDS:2 [Funneliformis geosporum]
MMIYKADLNDGFITSLFCLNRYYGITQNPTTEDFVIITKYYKYDLKNYITENFYNLKWKQKLKILQQVIFALENIHNQGIIHRDFHSGNILCENKYDNYDIVINDLGISKLSTEVSENDNNYYGIIPYIAPEIFQGKKTNKYTKASDIYSFSIIMWELMTGRRPFLNRDYDTSLIIEIIDGLRPPINTNAPEGYIKIMQECWHYNPNKRPTASKRKYKENIINNSNNNDKNTKKFKLNESYFNESNKKSNKINYISKTLEYDIN